MRSLRDCWDATLIPPDFSALFFVVFQEKLCLEIAGGFEESMAQKVQEELEQVERQVFVFEKEETELRLVRSIYFCGFCSIRSPLSITSVQRKYCPIARG